MAAQLIAVDAGALDALVAEVQELRKEVRQARIQPEANRITIAEYAARVDRSAATIRRWIREGRLECRDGLVPNPAV